jgi:NADP-dependent 3-hydroxy acid dehydrogenase YdfG
MTNDLSGRVVAITGASSGIGEATALACVAAGASVSLAARRVDRIEALAARIKDEGGTAIAVRTDVSDERQARAFVEQTYEHLGRLDVLVNNAGVMLLGPVAGANTDDWRRMIDANVYGVLYCSHAALPLMQQQGSGHIVNVSSVAGRIAAAGSAVYNLTKWGVNGFSEGLRQEALHSNIRVTIIEPGAVETELVDHNTDAVRAMAAKRMEGVQPLQATDIADAIVYALSQPEYVSINEVLIRPTRQAR